MIMVQHTFYIKKDRLFELKQFIRDNLNSARFLENPYELNTEYRITLSTNVNDANKLNELFNKWHDIDNSPKIKKSIWKRFFNIQNLVCKK